MDTIEDESSCINQLISQVVLNIGQIKDKDEVTIKPIKEIKLHWEPINLKLSSYKQQIHLLYKTMELVTYETTNYKKLSVWNLPQIDSNPNQYLLEIDNTGHFLALCGRKDLQFNYELYLYEIPTTNLLYFISLSSFPVSMKWSNLIPKIYISFKNGYTFEYTIINDESVAEDASFALNKENNSFMDSLDESNIIKTVKNITTDSTKVEFKKFNDSNREKGDLFINRAIQTSFTDTNKDSKRRESKIIEIHIPLEEEKKIIDTPIIAEVQPITKDEPEMIESPIIVEEQPITKDGSEITTEPMVLREKSKIIETTVIEEEKANLNIEKAEENSGIDFFSYPRNMKLPVLPSNHKTTNQINKDLLSYFHHSMNLPVLKQDAKFFQNLKNPLE